MHNVIRLLMIFATEMHRKSKEKKREIIIGQIIMQALLIEDGYSIHNEMHFTDDSFFHTNALKITKKKIVNR